MKSIRMKTILALALCAGAFAAQAANVTYWPGKAGLSEDNDYKWSTVKGWYKTRGKYSPNTAFGALPGPMDTVFVVQSQLTNAPLVIAGEKVCVSNLYLAATDGASVWTDSETPGQGTRFKMTSGSLDAQNFYMANQGSYWGVVDLQGGMFSVSNNVALGSNANNPGWSSITVGKDATMTCFKNLTVADRMNKNGFAVTNSGTLCAANLYIGPGGNYGSCNGTGIVYNAGILNVSGSVSLARNCQTTSASYLFLKEGSTFSFGSEPDSVFSICGTKGVGVVDTEIPLDMSSVNFTFGNGGSESAAYLKLRKNATLTGLSQGTLRMASAQYGGAYLEMYDNSVLSSVSTFECGDPAWCTVGITLRDHAVITNVCLIRSATTTGKRKGGSFTLDLDGDSRIVFTNSTESGNILKAYGRDEARADFRFAGNSVVANLDTLAFSCDQTGDLGGTVRMEGGTIAFRTKYQTGTLNLGDATGHPSASMVFSGYGTVTRTDLATLENANGMRLYCNFPTFRVEADGMGQERDLDLRAFNVVNKSGAGNAGTNGWYATNKGRLLYPRANKDLCGVTAAQPERTVGNYSQPGLDEDGAARPPTVFGTFNVAFSFLAGATGNKAYLYAAQYAADRDDYPKATATSVWANARVLNVYRLGAAKDWVADDPAEPYADIAGMSANFCYDTNRVDGVKAVNVYYSRGRRWRKIGTAASPKAGLVRTSTVTPISGESWNLGWFAVVEGELGPDTSIGFSVIVK